MIPYSNLLKAGIAILLAGASPVKAAEPKPTSPSGNALHMKRLVETTPKDSFRQMVYQNDINLAGGETYKISFWARASKPIEMRISTKNSTEPWAFFGIRENVKLTSRWKYYELTFMADEPIPGHTRLTFNYGGPEAGDIWIADVRLHPITAKPDSTENLVANARFEMDLENWKAEGVEEGLFLYEVQSLDEVEKAGKKTGN